MIKQRGFQKFGDAELAGAVAYAAVDRVREIRVKNTDRPKPGVKYRKTKVVKVQYYGRPVNTDFLRDIANEVGEKYFVLKRPRPQMQQYAGSICGTHLRRRNINEQRTYEAYLCAVMWMFAQRRAKKAHREAEERKIDGAAALAVRKAPEFPPPVEDPKRQGQFLLPLLRIPAQ